MRGRKPARPRVCISPDPPSERCRRTSFPRVLVLSYSRTFVRFSPCRVPAMVRPHPPRDQMDCLTSRDGAAQGDKGCNVPHYVVRWISHAARQISFISALRPPLLAVRNFWMRIFLTGFFGLGYCSPLEQALAILRKTRTQAARSFRIRTRINHGHSGGARFRPAGFTIGDMSSVDPQTQSSPNP